MYEGDIKGSYYCYILQNQVWPKPEVPHYLQVLFVELIQKYEGKINYYGQEIYKSKVWLLKL